MNRMLPTLAVWICLTVSSSVTSQDNAGVQVDDSVVRFASEVDVPALESGPLAEIFVRQNDSIEADSPIARLHSHSLQIERRSAKARYDSAERDAANQIDIQRAEKALEYAVAELETKTSMQNEFRGAVARAEIRKLRLGVELQKLEVRQAELDQGKALTNQALFGAELSLLDNQLENMEAQSPISGVVLDVAKSVGEWVNKGETIATVGRMDRLHIHAFVNSRQLAPALCKGLPVSVTWKDDVDGREVSLRGTVLSVDPQSFSGGRFRLHAEIANVQRGDNHGQWLLRPGTDVQMTVYPSVSVSRRQSASGTR
ncbi:putative efflux pump membrane fusion protein [Rubripirellula lacrimiformis]|uniref:Putative efflux pump membrane fusion protein n=1 Tax=Rubripirellula lacrimiformis TaxID=1930273 RepID=A0A517N830_9BACT|nr:HlyD family efflux transporter periplasmic adaptor subunit [Rubripirellula lacrimiformis]QDT03294.1 putative efflux pump membrane fusion protein [Rubripirellula lacrimiformis]